MELNYKGTFRREYNALGNRELIKALKKKIAEIKKVKDISHISRLKRFRTYTRSWYKIEITPEHSDKAYWILCTIRNNVVEFRRLKPEGYFKKNY
jgi:hypothetical protein